MLLMMQTRLPPLMLIPPPMNTPPAHAGFADLECYDTDVGLEDLHRLRPGRATAIVAWMRQQRVIVIGAVEMWLAAGPT